ncbi:hypothetical protein HG535_0G04350 [Zygotorulaspora mrakii]|uniref:STAS domain-containing protein n=1 Tax=Zygotorulaspora mrakii TaxID=42260 RepID=A0A7H9BA07_ZYGMR|nr:uncharacterized protein HG535_0G04350 [Zygotorulaspora mrakii]QLG74552.1 hypothetical protein HG535_0G04350 [Zygotorulaspora mrakii]
MRPDHQAKKDDFELSDTSKISQNGYSESTQDLDELELEYDLYKAQENNDLEGDKMNDRTNENTYEYGGGKGFKKSNLGFMGPEEPLFSADGIPSYNENTVNLREYYNHSIKEHLTLKAAGKYVSSIFPIAHWLPFYNLKWGYADLVAGITVGCVLVPQSMSYAQIATLPPQYGLYSSFIGAFMYCLFATSKDVCIGPVAVMSLQTAKTISNVLEKYPNDTTITGPIIATALSLLCGIVALGVGLLRLGFLVELISLNAVAGFMTGSAFNIIWGQIPALMGYGRRVNTRAATYKVAIETLKHLPDTKLDAVFGLVPLVILYFWKWWCSDYGIKLADKHFANDPKKKKILKAFYFYAQAMRNAIIIVVFTAISWSITRGKSRAEQPIRVLGTVPSGLKDVGVMKIPKGLLSNIVSELPASVIVLVLEHIAIAKSFARINDYNVIPDQELIAIGASNLVGTFFNAYPATGSFSRSALKAKCNVRTPFSGVFTGGCVLLALYCLTDAFYFIPSATLSAIIIHAVSDLLASYKTTYAFWKMNPLDFIAFIVTIFITVFSSIENGIYFAICWSCAMLLLKNAFPAGRFLGRVEVTEVINGSVQEDMSTKTEYSRNESAPTEVGHSSTKKIKENVIVSCDSESNHRYHTKWVALDHGYTRELNSDVKIIPAPPGVLVYRMTDSFTYLNCARHYDIIFKKIQETTRRGQLMHLKKKSDRPWNDPGEFETPKSIKRLLNSISRKKEGESADEESQLPEGIDSDDTIRDDRPVLKILCLDFSQVVQVDSTSIQCLVDLRKTVNRYADRQVEFHFSGIISSWVKRSLLSMKFGTLNEEFSDESIIAGHSSFHLARVPRSTLDSQTSHSSDQSLQHDQEYDVYAASGTNFPFFHVEIPDFSKWDV